VISNIDLLPLDPPTVSVYFVDDIPYFRLGGILAQRPHDESKFFRRYVTVFIFVEVRKRLLQFCIKQQIVLLQDRSDHFIYRPK